MLDIIKEYLVGLGFNVDKNSLDQAKNAMGEAEKTVSKFAGASVTQFAVAGIAVTAFVATATIGIAKFLEGLAKTDLESQKLARQLWMSKDNAMAFNNTLKAMGANLQDLYLSPELAQNFIKLRQEAFNLRPPDEYAEQMKFIRSIVFEFQRLKLEATYAMQWIGYYLEKYLQKPLEQFKLGLKNLNDSIVKNMPSWTKQVAQVASWFVRLGLAAIKGGEAIIKLFNSLPESLKIATGAFVGFFALLKMGPIGWIIAGLTAILLLLDDFQTYQEGGESEFPKMWKWLDDFTKDGKVTKFFDELGKQIDDFMDKIKNSGLIDQFAKTVGDLTGTFIYLIFTLGEALNALAKFAGYTGFGSMVEENIIKALKQVLYFASGVSDTIKYILDLLHLDTKKALEDYKSAGENLYKSIFGDKDANDNQNNSSGKKQVPQIWDDFKDSFKNSLGNGAMNYLYPQNNNTINNSITVSPTYKVYGGSDPNSTARAVQRTNDDLMIRSFQGVYI